MPYVKKGGHGGAREGSGRKRKPPLNERLSKSDQWKIGALYAEGARRLMLVRVDQEHDRRLRKKGITNVDKNISRLLPRLQKLVNEYGQWDDESLPDMYDHNFGFSEERDIDAAVLARRNNRKLFDKGDNRRKPLGRLHSTRLRRLPRDSQREIAKSVARCVGKSWRIRLSIEDVRECWLAFCELESRLIRDSAATTEQS